MKIKSTFFIALFFLLGCNASEEFASHLDFYSPYKDNQSHIAFKDTIPFVYSIQYYQIHASLYKSDSSFTLHSHFRGFDLGGGIQIKVSRNNDLLKVSVKTPTFPEQVLFVDEDYFKETKDIFFTFEVSNQWDNLFVNLWSNLINESGFSKKYYQSLKENRNLMASSKEEGVFLHSYGEGLKWGLDLHSVNLKSGKRTAIK